MKALLLVVLVPAALRVNQRPPSVRAEPRNCVATEHMPIVGLHRPPAEPMPVLYPDSSRRSPMPVIPRLPCYLVDSLPFSFAR
jgi:hypothetical protein